MHVPLTNDPLIINGEITTVKKWLRDQVLAVVEFDQHGTILKIKYFKD